MRRKESHMIIGMPESGKNFIFRLLLEEPIEHEGINEILYINLNNINKDDDVIFELKHQSKADFIKLQEIDKYLFNLCAQGSLIAVFNLGDNIAINSNIVSKLLQLRTRFGTDFTSVILGYTNVFNMITELNLKELLVKQVIPILPVNEEGLSVLIKLNSSQFDCKVSGVQQKVIKELSGGNPGLIKTLVQQVSEDSDWSIPNKDDQRLVQRLDRLSEGLSETQLLDIKSARSITQSDKFLLRFGYIINNNNSQKKIFSTLYSEYLLESNGNNDLNIIFTNQEEKILQLLQSDSGAIVDRTSIAKVIWGDNYLDLYSDYAIDKHISNIRKKINQNSNQFLIKTVKGRGYYISSK